jgi:hypothetical protein
MRPAPKRTAISGSGTALTALTCSRYENGLAPVLPMPPMAIVY